MTRTLQVKSKSKYINRCKQIFIYTLTSLYLSQLTTYSYAQTLHFNLVNTEIENIAQAVSQATKKNFILDPRVKGSINFNTEKAMNEQDVLQTLSSILRMQGFAMIEQNSKTILIVPESDAKLIASSLEQNIGGKKRLSGIVNKVIKLNYESANVLLPILRPLISSNNTISISPTSNALVITDYADNIARLEKIIQQLDQVSKSNKPYEIVRFEHAFASDVASTLSKLNDINSDTITKLNMVVDSNSNTLILKSNNKIRIQEMIALAKQLDQPYGKNRTVWFVPLKNADANKTAQVLRNLLSGEQKALSAPSSNSNPTGGSGNANSSSNDNVASNIQADIASNSLIIQATPNLYQYLRPIIDQMDNKRAQVFVESMIVEVSNQLFQELGFQWQALIGGGSNRIYAGSNLGNPSILAASSQAGNLVNLGSNAVANVPNGLSLGWLHKFGSSFGLAGLAKAMQNQGGVNILSTPNLMTLDNEEAKIVIGQNVPFVTGQYTNSNSSSGGANSVNPFQTIERNDVGLTLKVKPQVSYGDKVKLKIYQEVSSVDDKSNASGIITNKRSIDTTVEVNNGEMIILGGLLEDNYTDGAQKVPLLGDLPLVGNLFKYENKTRAKKNLMLFLRPYVVYQQDINSFSTNRYDYIKQVSQNFKTADEPSPFIGQEKSISRIEVEDLASPIHSKVSSKKTTSHKKIIQPKPLTKNIDFDKKLEKPLNLTIE